MGESFNGSINLVEEEIQIIYLKSTLPGLHGMRQKRTISAGKLGYGVKRKMENFILLLPI